MDSIHWITFAHGERLDLKGVTVWFLDYLHKLPSPGMSLLIASVLMAVAVGINVYRSAWRQMLVAFAGTLILLEVGLDTVRPLHLPWTHLRAIPNASPRTSAGTISVALVGSLLMAVGFVVAARRSSEFQATLFGISAMLLLATVAWSRKMHLFGDPWPPTYAALEAVAGAVLVVGIITALIRRSIRRHKTQVWLDPSPQPWLLP